MVRRFGLGRVGDKAGGLAGAVRSEPTMFLGRMDMRKIGGSFVGAGVAAGRADMGDLHQNDLVFHFRADTGITEATGVSAWEDQVSGSVTLAQDTAGSQPAYDATETVGTLANAGAMTFDGSNDLLSSTSVTVTGQPIHIFFVYKPITWTNNDSPFSGKGGGTTSCHHMQITSTPQAGVASGVDPGGVQNFTLGEWCLAIALFNGTSTTLARNDGTPEGDADNENLDMAEGFFLGAQAAIVQHANIAVGELAIYDVNKTGGDLTDIKDYFNDQYGLW